MSNARYLSIFEEIKKKGGSLNGKHPNDKVLIIDGLNTFIRVFSVIPTTNDDGEKYILNINKTERPNIG